MKLPFKNIQKPVNETEEKLSNLYSTIISFFEDRMDLLNEKMEDAGLIKKKNPVPGIVVGTLAGLAVGITAALKLPLKKLEIPHDIKLPKVQDVKLPVKETGEKVNHVFSSLLSFFENKLHRVEDKMEDIGIIEKKSTGPGVFVGVFAGLAVGAIAALLLARDSGEDFRSKVSQNFNDTKKKLLAKKDETLQFAQKETENVKNAVEAQTKDFTHHS